jgi:hypothetical protein
VVISLTKFIHNILLFISFIGLSSISHASLITNGSFEELTLSDDSTSKGVVFGNELHTFENRSRAWDVFSVLPGWKTSYGNGIELQKNVVTKSQDGLHHVELDSHKRGSSNSAMTQTLNSLTIGADYLLEFYYKPRTNNNNDNGINVYWYDTAVDFDLGMEAVLKSDSTRRLTPNWILQSVSFQAKKESMNLSFSSVGRQNTLGGLVDNVSLEQVTAVPEPSMFVIFLTAITLIFVRQRKLANPFKLM